MKGKPGTISLASKKCDIVTEARVRAFSTIGACRILWSEYLTGFSRMTIGWI